MKQKGESGEYLTTNPPYGYMKDPENPKTHWIIDDAAVAIIRQIFAWCMEGYGPSQIAHKLKAATVDCPTVHWAKMVRNAPAKTPDDPYDWALRTISGILERQEYLGHMVNFRTHRQSYKSKKKIDSLNGRFSRIPMLQLWMKKHFAVYRNFGRISAVLPERARAICFLELSAVRIVAKNCTTVPAIAMNPDRITLYVLLPIKRARMFVIHTSSMQLFWRREHFNI